jgi:hypothetical protein
MVSFLKSLKDKKAIPQSEDST